ncbi:hypothetical protein GGF32_005060 [Allomyces javanicus]|nr:hypothetical protein GGF32_005060 [Allomyces javanicus]
MAEGDTPAGDAPAAIPQLPSISLPPMTPPPANPPAASSSAPPAPAPEPTSAAPPPASSNPPPAPAPTSNPPPASSNPPPAPSSSAPAPAPTSAAPASSPSADKPAQAATTADPVPAAATSAFTPTPTPSTTWISSTVLITTDSATVITGTDGTTSTSSVRVTVPVVTVLPSTVYVVPRVNGSEAETAASGSFGGAALVTAIAIPVLLVAAIAGFLVVRRRRASRHGSASLFRKRSGRQDTGPGPSISVFQPSNPQASLVRPSLSAPLIGGGGNASGYEPVPHGSGSFKGSSTGSAAIPPTPAQVRAAQDQEARLHHEQIEQQHRLLYAAGDKDLPSTAHLTPPPPPMWAGHANASDPDLSHLSLAPPPPLAAPTRMYAHPAGSTSSGAFAPTVDPMSALLMDPLAEPMFADGPYDAHDDYALPPATTPLHTSVPLPPTGPVVPMPPTSAAGLATRAEVTNLVVRPPPQPPLPPMLPEYLPAPLQAPVHVPVEDQVVFAADPEAAMELLAGDERPESLASRSSLYLPTADRTMSGVWDEEREM